MKKSFITIKLLLLWVSISYATQQQPDILLIENDTMYIDIGWGHPSPLETYYSQNKIKYPFQMLHTANYRGHVATWSIENNKLYINKIQVNAKTYQPKDFIELVSADPDNSILAKWFTGFLLVRKYTTTGSYDVEFETYYYIRKGQVVKSAKYTKSDYERIRNEHKSGKKPEEIENTDLLRDYEKYVAYYFRLHDDEEIKINSQKGFISRPKGGKLILQYFNDVHLKWPYNWESTDKSGVPIGSWLIDNNNVFLTDIKLHTGLGFYETEMHDIEISEIFNIGKSQIKASWLNGIYIVQHRKEVEETDEFQLDEYEVESIRILEIVEGKVINQCELAGDFDIENVNEETPENTKKLINAYKELIE